MTRPAGSIPQLGVAIRWICGENTLEEDDISESNL